MDTYRNIWNKATDHIPWEVLFNFRSIFRYFHITNLITEFHCQLISIDLNQQNIVRKRLAMLLGILPKCLYFQVNCSMSLWFDFWLEASIGVTHRLTGWMCSSIILHPCAVYAVGIHQHITSHYLFLQFPCTTTVQWTNNPNDCGIRWFNQSVLCITEFSPHCVSCRYYMAFEMGTKSYRIIAWIALHEKHENQCIETTMFSKWDII